MDRAIEWHCMCIVIIKSTNDMDERCSRLEPCEGRLSRTVLRGGGDGNVASLPDQLVNPTGVLDGSNYAITSEAQDEGSPRLAIDGTVGGLVVWERDNGGSSEDDLYGWHLWTDGIPVGDPFTLMEANDDQQRPVIAGDGKGG